MNRADAGFTLWFTGLSGAGKSTVASVVYEELQHRGIPVELLDGDEVRTHLSKGLGFSRQDRDTNIHRIAFVARLLNRHGVAAIVAAISPYRETRDAVRRQIGNFIEVFVKCPIDVCISRDVKGLYKKALAGEISHFTGVSDPYEEPLNPELILETSLETPSESAAKVMALLEELGYIEPRQLLWTLSGQSEAGCS
ncbi:MAG: adenylyl-sulfate kinase [Firmicutes bacterium]|nr:adenylyl-sulfate kinase [Bacillota bacterium]